MSKRFQAPIQAPIQVPTAVLDGLETIRESRDANMQDRSRVKAMAAGLGYPETVAWIEEHPHAYTEGLFRGFMGY